MRFYAAILQQRSVAVLLLAAMVVRLSPAINLLAILLYTADTSGSFAIAGVTAGAFSLGTAIGAPIIGRLCDRRGIKMLLPFAVIHGVGLSFIWILGASSAPTVVVIAVALAAGSSYPPTGSALRARWPVLVKPALLTSAYALDSVAASISFLTGPLVTALLVATLGAGFALPITGSAVLVATAFFILRAPALEPGSGRSSGVLGALGAVGMRSLVIFIFAAGFCIGTIEVAIAAFSVDLGREELAGILLSLWSVSTAVASFFYGARVPRQSLRKVMHIAAFALPIASIPIVLAGSPGLMALLLIISATPYAPMFITSNQLVASVTPKGTETEAYTWVITAIVAGSAAGAAIGGVTVEEFSWQATVLTGAGIGLLGAVSLLIRKGTLATIPNASVRPLGETYVEQPTPAPGLPD